MELRIAHEQAVGISRMVFDDGHRPWKEKGAMVNASNPNLTYIARISYRLQTDWKPTQVSGVSTCHRAHTDLYISI